MPFAAAGSRAPRLDEAIETVCQRIRAELDGVAPDLTLAFVSHAHAEEFPRLAEAVRRQTGSHVLLGCSGETIVTGSEEVEQGPVLTLWSAVMPGAEFCPFQLDFSETPDGIVCSGYPPDLDARAGDTRAVLMLGEPFSSVPAAVLDHLAAELPGIPVIGGMASGGRRPGQNGLFLDSNLILSGAIGVVIRGGARVRSLVSQGCRPIGTHFVVTRADHNVILEIGGRPPLARLQEILPTLTERDQQLVRNGLHVGLVMNEYQDRFERGDFLISNVVGADAQTGAIAIGNRVRPGQTMQFHVRDGETADEDLRQLLERDRATYASPPDAALLFSCNGRGTRLFDEPHHDAALIQDYLGPLPLAGFFAQGELGPVGGRNYIHGYTASIALFG